MLKPLVIASLATLAACSSLPPILQRWGGLEIATTDLRREDRAESLYFSQDGTVEVHPSVTGAARISWRVRGQWLEIDTTTDGTYQTRMRASMDSLRRDIDSLTRVKRAVQADPAVQERIAREEFGMVKGNKEILYRFADPDSIPNGVRKP